MGRLTDTELAALAQLVLADALGRRSVDEARVRDGHALAYGDQTTEEQDRLRHELRVRGILVP